jgi:PAS domain S-box-containing protein
VLRQIGNQQFEENRGGPGGLESEVARLQLELTESRSQLSCLKEQLLEQTSDCVFELDRGWRFTFLNRRAQQEIAGGRDLLGTHILSAFPSLAGSIFLRRFSAVMAEGGARSADGFFPDLNAWYEVHVTPNAQGLTAFFRNISHRKRREARLRAGREHLEAILDELPAMIWSARPDGSHDYANRRWHEFTGVPHGVPDIVEAWAGLFHPEDMRSVEAAWGTSLATGCDYEVKYRMRTRTGAYRWVRSHARPELGEKGEILRWNGVCTDIHDRVLAQRALDESQSFTRSILESSPDCIKLMELDGTILYVNPLGPRALDMEDPRPLIGACWFDLLAEGVSAMARKAVETAARGERAQFTAMQPTATGREKWFDILATPVVAGGETTHVVVVARDITEQKVAEEALRDSELLHRSVLEASADCIKILALDGTLELMNAPGLAAMELDSFEAVRGKKWTTFWPQPAQLTVAAALEEAGAGRTARFTAFCPTAKGAPSGGMSCSLR